MDQSASLAIPPNAKQISPATNGQPKPQRKRSKAFQQAVDIQKMLLADALNPETPARDRALVASAWEKLEERKRILRMKPKPKDVVASEFVAERKARRSAIRASKPAFLDEGQPEVSPPDSP